MNEFSHHLIIISYFNFFLIEIKCLQKNIREQQNDYIILLFVKNDSQLE